MIDATYSADRAGIPDGRLVSAFQHLRLRNLQGMYISAKTENAASHRSAPLIVIWCLSSSTCMKCESKWNKLPKQQCCSTVRVTEAGCGSLPCLF